MTFSLVSDGSNEAEFIACKIDSEKARKNLLAFIAKSLKMKRLYIDIFSYWGVKTVSLHIILKKIYGGAE